jgi:hypothetical protein
LSTARKGYENVLPKEKSGSKSVSISPRLPGMSEAAHHDPLSSPFNKSYPLLSDHS